MFLFFFEDLNTLDHGLSACTGNNPWYYIGILRKSEGGGGGGGGGRAKNRFNFNNQHLQLCTSRTALSDSVIRSTKIG